MALGAAVGVYFALSNVLDKETVSWLCIVCAAPIAVTGFFQYNGLNFEKFVWAVIKSEFLFSGVRLYKSRNIYNELFEEVKQNDRTEKKHRKSAKRKIQNS